MYAIVDTHLHLYPDYRIEQAFASFLARTKSADESVTSVACLAERHDCHFFKAFQTNEISVSGFETKTVSAKVLEIVRSSDAQSFYLIPGRQVISSENIEVLALNCDQDINDGQDAATIIEQCKALGGTPVVAWSPGKWFGQRGKVVNTLLEKYTPADFLIGDTSLRPIGWGLPLLMRKAKKMGFKVIAGSDPLPFVGEENWFGAYCSHIESEQIDTIEELMQAFNSDASHLGIANKGTRSHFLSLTSRLRNNARSKQLRT